MFIHRIPFKVKYTIFFIFSKIVYGSSSIISIHLSLSLSLSLSLFSTNTIPLCQWRHNLNATYLTRSTLNTFTDVRKSLLLYQSISHRQTSGSTYTHPLYLILPTYGCHTMYPVSFSRKNEIKVCKTKAKRGCFENGINRRISSRLLQGRDELVTIFALKMAPFNR